MARKPVVTTLNASTYDILNVIRANASAEYQDAVPKVAKASDIRKVGEVFEGYPQFANYFLNALVNRIAQVRVKSATFNNDYKELKKGFLEYGETVEEVFVNIAKAREFSAEKASDRELKRTLPDVKSAFHVMNWRVVYPVTIQDEDLKQAFLSVDGVQDLIAKIVDSVYQANEYDEYLLFKYLIIKAVSHGKMYPVSIGDVGADIKSEAPYYRAVSNQLTFMKTKYNEAGVHTTTKKDDQYIFMDADYNAKYDVNVLAAAFNMDKATYEGHLKLIDDFTTFDNERFDIITANTDMIDPVTDAELALMANVKAVLVDKEWFQIYDNKAQFTEKYIAGGLYWNYFFHVWKTISSSPFSNAVVFVEGAVTPPSQITVEVTDKSDSENAITLTLKAQSDEPGFASSNVKYHQTEILTQEGIGVHSYGALLIPANQFSTEIQIEADINGKQYSSAENHLTSANKVGDTIILTQTEA